MRCFFYILLCAVAHFRPSSDHAMAEEPPKQDHDIFASDYIHPAAAEATESAADPQEEISASDYLPPSSSHPEPRSSPSLLKRISTVIERTLGVVRASDPEVRFFVLGMNQSDFRKDIFKKNEQRIPNLKLFRAINGYDVQETILQYNRSRLNYWGMRPGFESYGMLANFLTKYAFMKFQVFHSIPYACWIEDDVEVEETFVPFATNLTFFFKHENMFNVVRLDHWGEGYITSLEGAQRILALIEQKGIIDNPDEQLKDYCGPEIAVTGTPWQLRQPTNTGDILKTPQILRSRRARERLGFPPPNNGWQWKPPYEIAQPGGNSDQNRKKRAAKNTQSLAMNLTSPETTTAKMEANKMIVSPIPTRYGEGSDQRLEKEATSSLKK